MSRPKMLWLDTRSGILADGWPRLASLGSHMSDVPHRGYAYPWCFERGLLVLHNERDKSFEVLVLLSLPFVFLQAGTK